MKKFKFRLEKVLQFRRIVKDEKKRLFMEALASLQSAEARLEFLESERLRPYVTEGTIISSNDLFLSGLYGAKLVEAIAWQRIAVKECNDKAEEARAEFIEASKEVEVLEKLKEKRQNEYNEHVSKEEGKFLDELAVQRAVLTQR